MEDFLKYVILLNVLNTKIIHRIEYEGIISKRYQIDLLMTVGLVNRWGLRRLLNEIMSFQVLVCDINWLH